MCRLWRMATDRESITVYLEPEELEMLDEHMRREEKRSGLRASRTAVIRSMVLRELSLTAAQRKAAGR